MNIAPQPDIARLSTFLELEAAARAADTEKLLQFVMVNDTRRLLSYQQAFLLSSKLGKAGQWQLEAASSLAVLDRNSPLLQWLEGLVSELENSPAQSTPILLDSETCPPACRESWAEYSLPHVLWVPLPGRDGELLGGLWLSSESAWKEADITIVERLAQAYAHAWQALSGGVRRSVAWKNRKPAVLGTLVALVLLACFPIRMSTIAPVEVVAANPVTVSAPINGVISEIFRDPGTQVASGELVFKYEDTDLRNSFEITEQALKVAQARLRQTSQGAFGNAGNNAQLALLRAEVALKETERNFARELLSQVDVRAATDGLLNYSGKADWIGRPVVVGERIMEVADPGSIRLQIELPVEDAIVLNLGAEVKAFLDIDPLTPLEATIQLAHYNAEVTPSQVLAYRVYAAFSDPQVRVRIGLKGSARIYGNRVSLFFYLFRRPISALRQFTGL